MSFQELRFEYYAGIQVKGVQSEVTFLLSILVDWFGLNNTQEDVLILEVSESVHFC